MKTVLMIFAVLFCSCIDEEALNIVNTNVPKIWIGKHSGNIYIHNDSKSDVYLMDWQLIERLPSTKDTVYKITVGITLGPGGQYSISESTMGFNGTCTGSSTIFLYNSAGNKVHDCGC